MSNPVLRVFLIDGNPGLEGEDIDLPLPDPSLPDGHGPDGLIAIRTHTPSLPVVLPAGLDSESLALRAVQAGRRLTS